MATNAATTKTFCTATLFLEVRHRSRIDPNLLTQRIEEAIREQIAEEPDADFLRGEPEIDATVELHTLDVTISLTEQ